MSRLQVHNAVSGYTSLVGDSIDSLATAFSTPIGPQKTKHAPHITLLTKVEAQHLKKHDIDNPFVDAHFGPDDLVVLRKGGEAEAQFVVVLCNRANVLRRKVGLKVKLFHISLANPLSQEAEDRFHDLVMPYFSDRLSLPTTPVRTLDALSYHHFLRQDYSQAVDVSLSAIRRFPSSPQGFIRLADSSFRLERFKLSMVAYSRSFDLSPSTNQPLRVYCLKQIGRCSRWTEIGSTYLESEKSQFDGLEADARDKLLHPWSWDLRNSCTELCATLGTPDLSIESRERGFVRSSHREYGLPRFFRWIVPFRLAVSSTPRNAQDIQELASPSIGIKHIITLTEESPLPSLWFTQGQPGINPRHTFLPVSDQRSPSIEQIQLFLRLASDVDNSPLLVHCGGGKGRAGVMIASWISAFGFSKPPSIWTYPAFSAAQAIEILRRIRPGSIESMEQEEGVKRFYRQMSKDGPIPQLLPEPSDPVFATDGKLDGADLLVLVGLPGSGKSSFRRALAARDRSWRTVSSDEDGGKSAVLAAASALRSGDTLIVDRCNATIDSRRELLRLASSSKHPVAIHFSATAELCTQRAQARPDHPNLVPGGSVRAAIKQFSSQLVPPSLAEGFSAIVTVPSIASSHALVRRLTPPVALLKFPRTAHLLDLGAATSDDLVTPSFVVRPDQEVVITEKIDGANMGISLDSARRVVVQNRSHYVDSRSHPQFKKLDQWLDEHGLELQTVLGEDETYPERYILYGEWMAAKHSILYDKLPSLFIAFDLFDRSTSSFLPRTMLQRRLQETSIPLTPEIYRGPSIPNNLLDIIEQTSLFSNTERREGIYIKVEDAEKVVERLKVVRGDFIAGDQHWTKGRLEFNRVVREEQ